MPRRTRRRSRRIRKTSRRTKRTKRTKRTRKTRRVMRKQRGGGSLGSYKVIENSDGKIIVTDEEDGSQYIYTKSKDDAIKDVVKLSRDRQVAPRTLSRRKVGKTPIGLSSMGPRRLPHIHLPPIQPSLSPRLTPPTTLQTRPKAPHRMKGPRQIIHSDSADSLPRLEGVGIKLRPLTKSRHSRHSR